MDKMLYVAMSGASQNQMAMRAHANNLANVSTTGFRKDLEQARSMQVFGDTHPSRVYAMSERPATDFSAAALQETGRDLDVAIEGAGWIAVQSPDGGEAYVRTGSLEVDALGMLRTASGLPVLGNGGPIAVPPRTQIEIGQDGTVSIRAEGQSSAVIAQVDRLKLVNPDQQQMEKGSDGLIHLKKGQPVPLADASVRVVSGFVEASNVNAAQEMTSILSLSRQFELHIKMMRTAEDDAAAMAKVLQIG
ncbi:flagellar basal-body rod protein FlgF [Azomonas macrocytogenes]|uniref:Flagellar basal-body rod protein FlgF n=1 Tax=Azomonas macrocytogenes TaxID=69962 RepID=A0A839T823_AZOMA|nr:flagellar basal-body rod protein FlgF [Azomonas macrocytogenes]MBB3105000.1 flagellar basal-body rod protein FlgF [Azomonas macrocytogenes]